MLSGAHAQNETLVVMLTFSTALHPIVPTSRAAARNLVSIHDAARRKQASKQRESKEGAIRRCIHPSVQYHPLTDRQSLAR